MPHRHRRCRHHSTFSPVLSAYRNVATTRGNQCTQTSLPYIYYPQPPYHNRTKQPPSLPLYHPSKNHRNPSSSPSNPFTHHRHLPVYVYTVTPLIVTPKPPQKERAKNDLRTSHTAARQAAIHYWRLKPPARHPEPARAAAANACIAGVGFG